MFNCNIVYEDDCKDVDIVSLPDNIKNCIADISQEFLEWLPTATEKFFWRITDGQKYNVCETEGFIYWINNYKFKDSPQKACIVKQNVNFVDTILRIDF